MSQKPSYKKILEHPDREEVVSKLCIGVPPIDINQWLSAKYPNEKKFVIGEASLKAFQTTYLDFYQDYLQDLSKTKTALANGESVDDIELAIKKNPAYADALQNVANQNLDLESMISRLAINVETRISQIFDQIQSDPNSINTKVERLFIEYSEMFGNVLDKYYKWKESQANQMMSASISNQVVDRHISVFQDVIKELLSQIDIDSSLLFLELFNDRISKLKMPEQAPSTTTEMKIAETKLLNETINKKLNDEGQ